MTIEEYIALNNPKATARVIEAMGAPKIIPGDMKDLNKKVLYATNTFGLKAYEKLAEIDTPYRKLILSTISEGKSNCAGCGGGCGGHSNCSGCSGIDGPKDAKEFVVKPTSDVPAVSNNHLMVAGVVLLGILTIAVVVKLK